MAIHELKTDPDLFDLSARGVKDYEIRFNDRHFRIDDILVLKETKYSGNMMKDHLFSLQYTGRKIRCIITSIVGGYGLKDNWVILNVMKLPT